MKNYIIEQLNNPLQLEKLYRENKSDFKKQLNELYPHYKDNISIQIWHERLNFKNNEISFGGKNELFTLVFLILMGGLIANIPNLTGLNEELFFSKNISLIIFPILSAYFIWRNKISFNKLWLPIVAIIISAIYINTLPELAKSDSALLVRIHLPLFLWSVLGYSFIGANLKSHTKKIEFLKFNGDLIVMIAIIMLSCILFSVITFGLFELIQIKIEKFYFQYIAIWWIAAVPLIATYLIQNNPQIINKVSPIIAKIFTPLVFINLLIYLSAVIYTGKYPYNDRNLLLVFNVLLIGVMALILFSVAEAEKNYKGKFNLYILFGLSLLTIIINSIAFGAISFRILEYGITPNRIAVLGGNILIFIHLLIVSYQLFKNVRGKAEIDKVAISIAQFLPIYSIWTAIIIFILPYIFHFK
ncbi:MAG: hypothetical protein ACR2IM_00185 [Sediminibacterium sp.]